MNRKLSLHADRLQVVQLLLETSRVLKLHIWRVNADYPISMAAESEPFTSEIQLFVALAPINFEICGEVISAKSGSYEAVLARLQQFFAVDEGES